MTGAPVPRRTTAVLTIAALAVGLAGGVVIGTATAGDGDDARGVDATAATTQAATTPSTTTATTPSAPTAPSTSAPGAPATTPPAATPAVAVTIPPALAAAIPAAVPTEGQALVALAGVPAAGSPLAVDPAAVAPTTVVIAPGDDIQAAIDGHPEGATFLLRSGVHRGQHDLAPKAHQRFLGEPGAVLDGSVLVDGWATDPGGTWVAPWTAAEPPTAGQCDPKQTLTLCDHPDDLFFDDQPLRRVAKAADVTAGTWFLDYGAQQVRLGTDPTGHRVEIAVPGSAFRADSGRSNVNVEIRGLVIQKYGSAGQEGAIAAQDSNGGYWTGADAAAGATGGWLIVGNDIRLNHGAGVFAGNGTVVSGNRIERNGQIGIKATGRGAVFTGNDISANGWAGFDPLWEAGGGKFWNAHDVRFAGNWVHGNVGSGVWPDYALEGIVIERNVLEGNTFAGASIEMTAGVVVRENLIVGNDTADRGDAGYMKGGIFVYSAPGTKITGNVLRGNVGGVIALSQERGCIAPDAQGQGACPEGTERGSLLGLTVTGNDIEMTEGFSGVQLVATADYAPYAEQPVSWAQAALAPGAITWDANTYRGTGYDAGTGSADPRFVYAWKPDGADAKNIYTWTERRYTGWTEWRARSGFDATSQLVG